MANFFDRFNSKQLTIVIVCITACFLMMGACTMVLGDGDSDTKKEKKLVFDDDDDGSDEGGRKYKFSDEDRSEGSEDSKDSVKVKKPIEGDPYQELDELIGLEDVKAEVRSLANYVKVQKQRKDKGLKTPNLSYHLVFTGSPGTGKTTVARIVSRIYKDLGILWRQTVPDSSDSMWDRRLLVSTRCATLPLAVYSLSMRHTPLHRAMRVQTMERRLWQPS